MRRAFRMLLIAAAAVLICGGACVLFMLSRPRPEPEGPVARAAAAGSVDALRRELTAGAPADAMDHRGYTPLVWASREGEAEAVSVLVQSGADPDRRDHAFNGWTPLLHAVHKDQPGTVRALLAAGADVNRPSPNGVTPLLLAAEQGNAEIVEELLAAGADPRAEIDGCPRTVLGGAMLGHNPRVVEALLRKDPDLPFDRGLCGRVLRGFNRLRGSSSVVARLDEVRRDHR